MDAAIEREILGVLATETQAVALNAKLFSPQGLFLRATPTRQDRQALLASPLYRRAQARLSELQRIEAAAFGHAVEGLRAALPGQEVCVKAEGV